MRTFQNTCVQKKEMGKGKPNATLKDIAQCAGYSVNTVSRALRDKDDIAPETREKIKQIAMEMGHVNNSLAASLRLGYTNTIAVILGDVSNPHFAIMMKEIEGHARQQGYTSFLLNSNEDEELELAAIKTALNKSVDGIILCPTQKSCKNIKYLQATGIPFVLIGRKCADMDLSYVVCNDEMGGYQATRELLDKGHRDILMLNGPDYISSASERLAGYRRAFAEAGVPVKETLIREVNALAGGSCEQVLQELEAEQAHYTAIFAFSDMIAWEAWSSLRKRGVRIPEDCSLIGFDHIQSRLQLPFALTSVSSYKGTMSTTAVDLLLRLIREGSGAEKEEIVIDTKLAEGETVLRWESGTETK